MNFRLLLLIAFTGCALSSFSQEPDVDVTNVTKITIMNPGLSHERRIGKFQTVYGQFFMNLSTVSDYSNSSYPDIRFYFDPAVTLQYRYYYNAYKRAELEKRTAMNSMNYIALITEFIASRMPLSADYFEESSLRAVTRFGAAWGFQRNLAGRFSIDLNLGLGYLTAKGTRYNGSGQLVKRTITAPSLIGQLNLGFWINKKNAEE